MKGIKKTIRDNRFLNWILILSNWCFQGVLHADKTEKIYKIFFTLFFWFSFGMVFYFFSTYSLLTIFALSFFISHSLNWIVNGNFYILLVHRVLFAKISKQKLFIYLNQLENKIQDQDWVLYCASFGSICRGDLKDSSDIDVSVVRKPGIKNAFLSIAFSMKEKKYADLKGIPLELFISDTPKNSIKRFKAEKNPVVIFDPENTIDQFYQEKLTIEEAKKLNHLNV